MALPLTSFGVRHSSFGTKFQQGRSWAQHGVVQEVVLLLGQQLVVLALAYKYSNAPGWRQAVAFTVLAGFATLCFTGVAGLPSCSQSCCLC